MPALGFGTSSIQDPNVFFTAVKVGYRHFDTATKYGNEAALGEAINRAIAENIVTREELFVTTKLWHDDYADPEAALRLSLTKLNLQFVDLYLIHWPLTGHVNKVPMHVLWAKMEDLVSKGLTKSIGVSNFNVQLLADMLTYAKIPPAVN